MVEVLVAMARRGAQPILSESEPTILVPVPCTRCATCKDCDGTHVKYLETHDIPVGAELEVDSGLAGATYKVNGYRANKTAFDLALDRVNGSFDAGQPVDGKTPWRSVAAPLP